MRTSANLGLLTISGTMHSLREVMVGMVVTNRDGNQIGIINTGHVKLNHEPLLTLICFNRLYRQSLLRSLLQPKSVNQLKLLLRRQLWQEVRNSMG
jgi:hypothetical protein